MDYIESPLDIEVFRTVWFTYSKLDSESKSRPHLNAIAKMIGCDKDTLARRLNEFHTRFNTVVVDRKQGRGAATVVNTDAARTLMQEVGRLLSHYDLVIDKSVGSTHRHLVQIGCSPLLAEYIVPEGIRRTHDDPQNRELNFDVAIETGRPQDLRRKGIEGRYDLVLTSYSPDSDERDLSKRVNEARCFEGSLRLQSAILVDRRHPLAHREHVEWDELKGMTIVWQNPDRRPRLEPPPQFKDSKDYRVIRAESYRDALAMTLCRGEVCCAAFPQLLSSTERTRFCAIYPPGMPEIDVVVLRPPLAIKQATEGHNRIVDILKDVLVEDLRRVASLSPLESNDSKILRTLTQTWNATRESSGNPELRGWMQGELTNISVAPDGHFQADHKVAPPRGGGPLEFVVSGQISEIDSGRQIVWRGHQTERNGNTRNGVPRTEEYAASILIRNGYDPLETGVATGIWAGRCSWNNFHGPDTGFFVLTRKDVKATEIETLVQTDRPTYESLVGLKIGLPSELNKQLAKESRKGTKH